MKTCYALLLAALTACSLPDARPPQFAPGSEQQWRPMVDYFDPQGFSVGTEASASDGITTRNLTIKVKQPAHLPERKDSLEAAARRLATAVTRSLTNPQDYELVIISVDQKHEYGVASVTLGGTYRYPVQGLRN